MMFYRVIVLSALMAFVAAQVCSPGPVDVMFVLSSDASLDKAEFDKKLQVVSEFVQSVNIGPDEVRVGLITEYDYADLEFHMDDHMNKTRLLTAISFTYFYGGYDHFGSGLEYIQNYGMDNYLGGRPGVPDVIIVLTDGLVADTSVAQNEVDKLTDANVTVIVVGVGDFDKKDLVPIASGCHYVQQHANFSSINNIVSGSLNLTCDAINDVPSNPCHNGGTCVVTGNTFDCRCADGYTGVTCDTHHLNVSVGCNAEVIFMIENGNRDSMIMLNLQVDFIAKMMEKFRMENNGTRVGVVIYGTTVTSVIHLNTFTNDDAGLITHLRDMIRHTNVWGGLPELGKALDYVRVNVLSNARPGAAKVVIPIVHQMAFAKLHEIPVAADQVKNEGVYLFGLSVDQGPVREGLIRSIVTRDPEFHGNYSTFDELKQSASYAIVDC